MSSVEELRKAASFELTIPSEYLELSKTISNYQAQFRLPAAPELQSIVEQYKRDNLQVAALARDMWRNEHLALGRAMAAMSNPWLDARNLASSINGFTELQGIGRALQISSPFDERISEKLRVDLGDWQEVVPIDETSLLDPVSRTSFYLDRGLNPSLTAFPASAFIESTEIAGLRDPITTTDESPNHQELDDEESAFIRTNAAHDKLMRFETMIRQFIEERMRSECGDKWIKQRVPAAIRQSWEQKRQATLEAGGEDWPLIAFADFTDYIPIITRRDNWEGVFASIFKRSESIRESFQRLYPIRICTMHARLITQDDELYLLVETKRILKAIGQE